MQRTLEFSFLVYEDCQIYGPYQSKTDKRLRVVVREGKTKRTISYPKFLVEKRLNRYLSENEIVDHIDGNFLTTMTVIYKF